MREHTISVLLKSIVYIHELRVIGILPDLELMLMFSDRVMYTSIEPFSTSASRLPSKESVKRRTCIHYRYIKLLMLTMEKFTKYKYQTVTGYVHFILTYDQDFHKNIHRTY